MASILTSIEAEGYIKDLKIFKLEEVGSDGWLRQHDNLEKLNMQSVISARLLENEFVKEFLINHDRYPMLVYNLLLIELWKERVFEELKLLNYKPNSSLILYTILYHEATLVNLLECTLYHSDSIETLQDAALDLEDYCYRKLSRLVTSTGSTSHTGESEDVEDDSKSGSQKKLNSTLRELDAQCQTMEFDIGIRCVSIIQYMIEHASLMHATVLDRLLRIHDIPILLVQLVECAPWCKLENGVQLKFIDGKWVDTDKLKESAPAATSGSDASSAMQYIPKCEVQCWLALFNSLLNEQLRGKYELNSYRKSVILKLRSALASNRDLLDAVPTLVKLIEYLDKLSLYDPLNSRSELILEQLPQLRDAIEAAVQEYADSTRSDNPYRSMAQQCIEQYFTIDEADLRKRAAAWTAMYDTELLEKAYFTEPPRCVLCGALAKNRCSRCRNEWYCKRECQVKHWSKHKKACDLLVLALNDSKS